MKSIATLDFDKKVAIVTGGTGALGQAVSRRLLAGGAAVAVPYAVPAEADALRDALAPSERERLLAAPADVTDPVAAERFAADVLARFGRLDVLVCAVGGFAPGDLVSTPPATWHRMLALNLTSAYAACRAALPAMIRARAGRVVIVASRAVQPPAGGFLAYTVAKSGALALTQALAQEVRPHGITVNAVLPSTMDTPANRRAMPDADRSGWVSVDSVAGVIACGVTAEGRRLEEARARTAHWRRWGPYLTERQWGTVREDYSPEGTAWEYFPHDHARSRAYRWGEDGLAGISDNHQRLCFALALWNGRDPILKERLFGLTGNEGNHGEDVKEYYFYLDSTPTHSYMKYLYKYPQAAFPYGTLVEENRRRGRGAPEYELLDTGVFDENRYFDVFVEYAKAAPDDVLIQITAVNRGPEPAPLDLLPTLWFRNTWSWEPGARRPRLCNREAGAGYEVVKAEHETLGRRWLLCEGVPELLFIENDTNTARLFGAPNASEAVKDGINDYVVHRRAGAVNGARVGSKAAVRYQMTLGAGESAVVRLRLCDVVPAKPFGGAFEATLAARAREADAFYATVTPPDLSDDARRVMRQAFAGLLWSKQFYH
ncbi:MAG: SDR family oxidoreductase, partial [Candidatus Rokubacteria bacterium]|nr:SDR family oxidoreductase [Candidatus Rokubacteria bacterium]